MWRTAGTVLVVAVAWTLTTAVVLAVVAGTNRHWRAEAGYLLAAASVATAWLVTVVIVRRLRSRTTRRTD